MKQWKEAKTGYTRQEETWWHRYPRFGAKPVADFTETDTGQGTNIFLLDNVLLIAVSLSKLSKAFFQCLDYTVYI